MKSQSQSASPSTSPSRPANSRWSLPPWLVALLGGLLMGLTPAPFNMWPLAWMALIPLWIQVRQLPVPLASDGSRRLLRSRFLPAFRLGLLWGIGYHGLALSWLTHLHPLTWMGIPWLGSIAISLFAWGFVTLWGGILVGAWAIGLSLLSRSPLLLVLGGTALWCALETLWSQGPLWWTALAYTQSPYNLAILHLGQLSGPAAVAAVIVAVNGLLAEAWLSCESPGRDVGFHRLYRGLGFIGRNPYGVAAIAFLLSCHLLGFGLYSRPLMDFPAEAIRIGLIQGNVPTRIKLTPEGRRQALQGYTDGYKTLVDQNVNGVILPEGALPTVWETSSVQRNPLYEAIVDRGVMAWVGAFGLEEGRITQSLLTVTGEGETVSRYDKVKLVPLGEYIPFVSVLGRFIGRLSTLDAQMLPGNMAQEFDTPLGRAAVGICYESAYPEIFRVQVVAGGQFLLMPSNDDPYPRWMMAQHHALDVMRAIELDRWAVRATNTGLSGVVDPHGHTVWLSERRQYTTHAETIYRRQSQTLYVRWGNWLTMVLGVLTAISLILETI